MRLIYEKTNYSVIKANLCFVASNNMFIRISDGQVKHHSYIRLH